VSLTLELHEIAYELSEIPHHLTALLAEATLQLVEELVSEMMVTTSMEFCDKLEIHHATNAAVRIPMIAQIVELTFRSLEVSAFVQQDFTLQVWTD
jgi:hypothetical protein